MGIKKQMKKARKATSKAANAVEQEAHKAVDAVDDAVDASVDWAEGVGKSVAKQAINLSAEVDRMAGDAAAELVKYGGDMVKAIESGVWLELLKKLARQVVKDNDGLIQEGLKTARAIEQKSDEIRTLAAQSTRVFTREIEGDAVTDGAIEIAEALNF